MSDLDKQREVRDLQDSLKELKANRRDFVYFLARTPINPDDPDWKKLARLQSNIAAFEAVINSGEMEPEHPSAGYLASIQALDTKRSETLNPSSSNFIVQGGGLEAMREREKKA